MQMTVPPVVLGLVTAPAQVIVIPGNTRSTVLVVVVRASGMVLPKMQAVVLVMIGFVLQRTTVMVYTLGIPAKNVRLLKGLVL